MSTLLLLAFILACSIGVVASGSRTATILLPLGWLTVPFLSYSVSKRFAPVAAMSAAALLLAAGAGALISTTGRGELLLERFKGSFSMSDPRFGIWEDTRFAAELFFPAGSGLGTFQSAFDSVERLSEVGTHYTNHAHNDYLELAVESGAPGTLLLGIFLIWFIWRSWRIWQEQELSESLALARAASVAVLLILLHSATDYPLRTAAILTLFGLFVGIFARKVGGSRIPDDGTRRPLA